EYSRFLDHCAIVAVSLVGLAVLACPHCCCLRHRHGARNLLCAGAAFRNSSRRPNRAWIRGADPLDPAHLSSILVLLPGANRARSPRGHGPPHPERTPLQGFYPLWSVRGALLLGNHPARSGSRE